MIKYNIKEFSQLQPSDCVLCDERCLKGTEWIDGHFNAVHFLISYQSVFFFLTLTVLLPASFSKAIKVTYFVFTTEDNQFYTLKLLGIAPAYVK